MYYSLKVKLLKNKTLNYLWRYWLAWRGEEVGNYSRLPEYIRQHAPGKSFADIGCMWGVNGDFAFIAEEAGASTIKGVDVFGPTPEFEEKVRAKSSRVQFILGDITRPKTIKKVGVVDVVLCAGVLYHHPSPFDLLVALRRICKETLILRTATIPENKEIPNSAVFFPYLSGADRSLWNLSKLGVGKQDSITDGFNPEAGYGNWFWGLSPSCVTSMLELAGFDVTYRATEAFAQNFICSAKTPPFEHYLPDEEEARKMGQKVSASGIARPS